MGTFGVAESRFLLLGGGVVGRVGWGVVGWLVLLFWLVGLVLGVGLVGWLFGWVDLLPSLLLSYFPSLPPVFAADPPKEEDRVNAEDDDASG